jgi:hypothetical protein
MLIQFRSRSRRTQGPAHLQATALDLLAHVVHALVPVGTRRPARPPAIRRRDAPASAAARSAAAGVRGDRHAHGCRACARLAAMAAGLALGRRRTDLAGSDAIALITASIAKGAVAARLAFSRLLLAGEARGTVASGSARAIAALHAGATLRARRAKAAVIAATIRVVSRLAVADSVAAPVAESSVVAARLALGGGRIARLSRRAIAGHGARHCVASTFHRALCGRASTVGTAIVISTRFVARAAGATAGSFAARLRHSDPSEGIVSGIDRVADTRRIGGRMPGCVDGSATFVSWRRARSIDCDASVDCAVAIARVARRTGSLQRDRATHEGQRSHRCSDCNGNRHARPPEPLCESSHCGSVPNQEQEEATARQLDRVRSCPFAHAATHGSPHVDGILLT